MKARTLDIHIVLVNGTYTLTILGEEIDFEYFEPLIDHIKEQVVTFL